MTLGVLGTPFRLQYQSERVPGRKVAYELDIPLSGSDPLPDTLRHIELEIQVAGQFTRQRFSPAPNQRTTFQWDGKNAYGQAVQGEQPIAVRIGYTYKPSYGETSSFGAAGTAAIAISGREEVTLWRNWTDVIGTWGAPAVGLGGWSLSAQHAYVPSAQILYRGDGGRQSARAIGPIISTVAGNGTAPYSGDGGPATAAQVAPQGLAVGPDGSLYIASPPSGANRVRRVASDGIMTTFAGTGAACSATAACGDGGPATQAQFASPFAVAVGPDNSLYISDGNPRVRKVGPDGIITTIAGTGTLGFSGDGGPATLAQLGTILSLAAAADGSVYIDDQGNKRIRRVGPDGIISTVAGRDASGRFSGDGGPATLAQLADPRGVAVGPDGSVYIADVGAQRVRRVTPDGIVRTIAGSGDFGFSGDNGPATAASFRSPHAVAVDRDNTLYIVDQGNNRIRWMRPDGPINTLAGNGFGRTSGDAGLARQAELQNLESGLAVGPDGTVYFAQTGNDTRVRQITPVLERAVAGGIAVPSGDGAEVYVFTPNGRHLQTFDAVTGTRRYQFGYDGAGRLGSVTDGDGNVTTIEHAGTAMTIVSPFGQRTVLATNADGYLSRVTSPGGEVVQLTYTTDGLLTSLTNPRGRVSQYAYDRLGRLTGASDPTGASKTLAFSGTNAAQTVTLTTALGRITVYRVERLDNDDLRLTTTDPAGAQIQVVTGTDGAQTATYPDGTVVRLVLGPDPRWGMQAPVAASVTVTTPGGSVQTTTTQRTATLANPGDVLNLRTLTETTTVNGRVSISSYDAPTRTLTRTSPGGRRDATVVDDRGRPVQTQFGDLDPTSFTYDSRGRLASVTQGQATGSRVSRFAYGSDGFLASVADPIGRAIGFTRDTDGRVTEESLPDGRLVRYAYDANSNLSTLTPPGRSDHMFSYTDRDEVSAYFPPTVGAETSQSHFSYDADRMPLREDHPDGQAVGFQYDSAGRLSLVDLATGQRTYGYDLAGRLISLGTSQSIALAYAHDGGLPIATTWSGAVAGSVSRTYDSDFRVTALSVNGSNPLAVQYDPDSLRMQVGALSLTRSAQTGLVTTTALGSLSDTTSYDSFGAPNGYTASQSGSPVYSALYTRDLLGRLASQNEMVGGATGVASYTYDLAGRLSEVRQDGVLAAAYTYDANGNRLTKTGPGGTITASYDAQDRLTQYGSTTYAYTANGELRSRTAAALTTT
jgi:YD repeat-containing protein